MNSPNYNLYTELSGRLGNLLFQVFSSYGMSMKSGRNLIIFGNSAEIDPIFRTLPNLKYMEKKHVHFHNLAIYDETNESDPIKNAFQFNPNIISLFGNNDGCLFGYFQNEKYFCDYRETIYKILENKEITDRLLYAYPSLPSHYFIHIRRGDYVGNHLYTIDYDTYYRSAISYVLEQDPMAQFFIVSDDVEYCKTYSVLSNLRLTFIENMDTIDTLYFMSLCSKGGICCNSSFSWWGSYMNPNKNKIVTMPRIWMNISKPIDIYYEGVIIL